MAHTFLNSKHAPASTPTSNLADRFRAVSPERGWELPREVSQLWRPKPVEVTREKFREWTGNTTAALRWIGRGPFSGYGNLSDLKCSSELSDEVLLSMKFWNFGEILREDVTVSCDFNHNHIILLAHNFNENM